MMAYYQQSARPSTQPLTHDDYYELFCWMVWFMDNMKGAADVTSYRHPVNNMINYLAFLLKLSSDDIQHHKEVCKSMRHAHDAKQRKRMYDLFFFIFLQFKKDTAFRQVHLKEIVKQKLIKKALEEAKKKKLEKIILPDTRKVDAATAMAIKDHDDSFDVVQHLLHAKLLKWEPSDPSVGPLTLGTRLKGRKRARDGEEVKKKKKEFRFGDINQRMLYDETRGLIGKPIKQPSKAIKQVDEEEEAKRNAQKSAEPQNIGSNGSKGNNRYRDAKVNRKDDHNERPYKRRKTSHPNDRS